MKNSDRVDSKVLSATILSPKLFAKNVPFKRHLEQIRETCPYVNIKHSCETCGREKLASCRGRLLSIQFYGIEIVESHFRQQEMSPIRHIHQTTTYYQVAHEALVEKLEAINATSTELNRKLCTAEAYRNLYAKTAVILAEHSRLFEEATTGRPIGAQQIDTATPLRS